MSFYDDPVAWRAYLAEGNVRQARKRVSADVIFRDADGRVLLVDPAYKPGWDLPGGMAEANESPRQAARREVEEELGFSPVLGRLLVVDWVPPHDPWDDLLAFVFDGGRLGDLDRIRFQDGELLRAEFSDQAEVEQRLAPRTWRRLQHALRVAAPVGPGAVPALPTAYDLEDGAEPEGGR